MALVIDQSNTAASVSFTSLRFSASFEKIGIQFVPTVSTDVIEVHLNLKKTGTPTGNIWVEVWTDTGSNAPNAITGSASANVDVSTIPGSETETTFTFAAGTAVTASTKYWIVVRGSYTINGTDYAQVYFNNTAYNVALQAFDSGGPGWSTPGAGNYGIFKELIIVADTGEVGYSIIM
jgi:hypothetical protein